MFEQPHPPITKAQFKALTAHYGKVNAVPFAGKAPFTVRFVTFAGGLDMADMLYHGVLRFEHLNEPDTTAGSIDFESLLPAETPAAPSE